MDRSPWLRVHAARLNAPFRLAFAPAPGLLSLSHAAQHDSQAHSTKGTPPPSRAVTSCRFTVSGSLSLPSRGFFSPFPHGTRSLSVAAEYLALDRGRPGFGQGSSCPALLRILLDGLGFRLRGSHALRQAFPCLSANLRPFMSQSYNPARGGLGSSAFARRYSRNLC